MHSELFDTGQRDYLGAQVLYRQDGGDIVDPLPTKKKGIQHRATFTPLLITHCVLGIDYTN